MLLIVMQRFYVSLIRLAAFRLLAIVKLRFIEFTQFNATLSYSVTEFINNSSISTTVAIAASVQVYHLAKTTKNCRRVYQY